VTLVRRQRTIRLGAVLQGLEGLEGLDVEALVHTAQVLDRAGFTALLVGGAQSDEAGSGGSEPFTLLAALSSVTERIGLVAVTVPSDDDPFTIARKAATLDHLSSGRAGWAIAGELDERSEEFVDVVRALWDSTDDDGVIADKASGVYLPTDARRPIDHHGPAYSVAGPLNLSRPPQGHPLMFFLSQVPTDRSFGTAADGRSAESTGRPTDTDDPPEARRPILSDSARPTGRSFGTPSRGTAAAPRDHESAEEIGRPTDRSFGTSAGDVVLVSPAVIGDTSALSASLEDPPRAGGRAPEDVRVWLRTSASGSPTEIASRIERWWRSGAIDGVALSFSDLPATAERFVDEVLPILADRGLFDPARQPQPTTGTTLRDALGLSRPSRPRGAGPTAAGSAGVDA
jgi:alkanesulfonate monooxygenase SsuD/methylene tetrahydromethanopterin reductase-like flavin-dependent oxidoreductase (luciferase family)